MVEVIKRFPELSNKPERRGRGVLTSVGSSDNGEAVRRLDILIFSLCSPCPLWFNPSFPVFQTRKNVSVKQSGVWHLIAMSAIL